MNNHIHNEESRDDGNLSIRREHDHQSDRCVDGQRPIREEEREPPSPARSNDTPITAGGAHACTQQQIEHEYYFGKVTTKLTKRGTFGKYQLVDILGKGSFGMVYRGRDKSSGGADDDVAIKTILKSLCKSHDSFMRLRNEVELLLMLDHVNIIGCTEAVHGKRHIAIVTPICYMDLFCYIRQARRNREDDGMSWDFVRHVTFALSSGLGHLHDNNTIHLDIKLKNILVKRKAPLDELTWLDFCICDLGMCQQGDEGEDCIYATKRCGTTGFTAPELYAEPGEFDGRHADMFSCGATLLDMTYGLTKECYEAYHVMKVDAEKGAKFAG